MKKQQLHIIKIGGNVIDDEQLLKSFIHTMASVKEPCILIHGGGKIASELSRKMQLEVNMIDGRRVTDAATLDIVVMVYAGLINKRMVAMLQSESCNAIGLCGADANIIPAKKRVQTDVDYGFVGDLVKEKIASETLSNFISQGLTPVVCAITHDEHGQLLNTNADTIASALAVALSNSYSTRLYYCFEKKGVMRNIHDEHSLISSIDKAEYEKLKMEKVISEGMIPKLDNAFDAIENGASAVCIGHASGLTDMIYEYENAGTKLIS